MADLKGLLKLQEHKSWKTLFEYIILKCCVSLTIKVLSMFSAQFLVLSRFSYCFGKILSYLCTWTDTIHISRFSWFPGCAGNPWARNPERKHNVVPLDVFSGTIQLVYVCAAQLVECCTNVGMRTA